MVTKSHDFVTRYCSAGMVVVMVANSHKLVTRSCDANGAPFDYHILTLFFDLSLDYQF